MNAIRLGTSGYSFGHWRGDGYPTNLRRADMFRYYVDQLRLNSVEINHTFYVMPARRVYESYARNSPDGFDFAIKLFGGITHEPWLGSRQGEFDKALCAQLLWAIQPIAESGKLGCILAQFPWFLPIGQRTWDYLLRLRDEFKGIHLIYEFRHRDWLSDETLDTLSREGIGFCTVDEPQVWPLMPLVAEVTSDIAYLRLHGRNAKWFEDRSVRYDYCYSETELTEMLPTISLLASQSTRTYIQFNNCHAGAALRNVKMMQYLLGLDLPPMQGVIFPGY